MPKRLPGGKVKRGTKPARARTAQRPPAGSGAPESPASSQSPASGPARRAPAPVRQSLLSTVRRPAQKAGPALITDYSYVRADLKRIGVVSAGALVILVVLAFVIQ